MFTNNPFSELTEIISPIAIQGFVIAMIALVAAGTLIDIIHKIEKDCTVWVEHIYIF